MLQIPRTRWLLLSNERQKRKSGCVIASFYCRLRTVLTYFQLLVQLQNKDQTIKTLTDENANFSTALNTTEARLYEFYTEQGRMEEEMSARIEVTEKLRTQIRELEKERRDLHRRYNEQVSPQRCT